MENNDIELELDEDDLEYLREAGATKNPADYYFQVFYDPAAQAPESDTPLFAIITPKKYFDDNGYQFDGHISQEAGGLLRLAPDYYELEEGSVEPGDESATFASMEADLKARGFIPHLSLGL